jgi:ParB-like chromosome segregation protein Spo0J
MGMFDKAKKAAADTFTEDIKMIDIESLRESPDNFFVVDRIEEFAETILGQGGIKENLIVKPIGGENYEIISGHRRAAAMRYLLDRGESVSRYLPCLVQEYKDEDEKLLDVVLMNVSARIITDAQMWKCYEIVSEILQNKKRLGEKFGKIQNKLAEILNISPAQVAKIQNIDNNASASVKEAIKKGDISIHSANEAVKQNRKGTTNSTFSKDGKKGTTNSTFSEDELIKSGSIPLFVRDVITAWNNLDLSNYGVKDYEKAEILATLVDGIKSAKRKGN